MVIIKGLTTLAVVLFIVGLGTGVVINRSDILNPERAAAEVRQMDAHTAALQAQSAFDQRAYEIQLDKLRAQAEIERLAMVERANQQAQWEATKARVFAELAPLVSLGLLVALGATGVGLGVYLGCRGLAYLGS